MSDRTRPTRDEAERRLLADIHAAQPTTTIEHKGALDRAIAKLHMAESLVADARRILKERL